MGQLRSPTSSRKAHPAREPPAPQAGQLTFSQAEDIYRERLELNNKLKPARKEYRHKTLSYLHGTWPRLAGLDLARISVQDCSAWATRFKKAKYSPTVFNNTLGTLKAIFALALEAGARYGNPPSELPACRCAQSN